ncbi:hybrid sensor histidine kinase/response regulator [Cohnella silvisoli]|uniref:histidine kinase n=1 Tax=Cohnella silvisoli TaxID=2873699 RepID=A0ABV1KZ98_9BACL|nr:ATP-binding protein [Cohnella silvisoli]MCD9024722.1 response regulator [Cohnella silvisoli]
MLKSWKLWLLFVLFILAIIYRAVTIFAPAPSGPAANNGLLDLREWNLKDEGPVAFRGDWQFFSGKLLTPAEISAHSPGQRVQLPRNWNDYVREGKTTPFGYGTYHITVQLQENTSSLLGMRISDIHSAHALYVNGRLIETRGNPSSSKQDYIADQSPYPIYFESDRPLLDLVIQVANYDTAYAGGMLQPIWLGLQPDIMVIRESSIVYDMFSFCIFGLLGVCFLVVYAFIRKDKAVLYIGLFLAIAAIYLTTLGEKLLLETFPDISNEWGGKIHCLSYAVMMYSYISVTAYLGGKYSSVVWVRIFQGIIAVYGLICLLAPAPVFTSLELPATVLTVVMNAFSIWVLMKSCLRGNKDAAYYLVSTYGMLYQMLMYVYYLKEWISMDDIDILGLLLSMGAMVLLISGRILRNFVQNERLSQQLLKSDKTKNEFLANTSHELRTPLHGMINIVQSLLEGSEGRLTAGQEANLKMALTVGRRMSHLLHDILDLSYINDDAVGLNRQPVHVRPVVAAVLSVMSYLTDGKNISLNNRVSDQLPAVYADEHRLFQIIFNLIHNAIKHTPEGEVRIEASEMSGSIEIIVSDTGVGIPKERQEEIFQSFIKGNGDNNTRMAGVGLGLSICKRLVELHGGNIRVQSVPGEGTAFSFAIPVASEQPDCWNGDGSIAALLASTRTDTEILEEYNQKLPSFVDSEGEKHIAIVDDDPVNVHVMLQILSSERMKISVFSNGEDLLKELEGMLKFDLIVLDVMLPQMSGYEVCNKVRERYTLYELPVLMLTARSQLADLVTGFQAGANDYVVKPIERAELKSRVRTLLSVKVSAIDHIRMETNLLQAQINPHFLFNTLNSIASLMEEDSEQARELLIQFGNYLKGSFDPHNQSRFVPFYRELALVRSYLYIEKIRFDERLEVVVDVPEQLHVQVPPLILQPIVENAVRHGVMKRIQGGTVRLTVTDEENDIVIQVADNGAGMTEAQIEAVLSGTGAGGVGIFNTDRRLKYHYGRGLDIRSVPTEGTQVTMRIPKG